MKTILLSIVMMGAALTADAQATVKVNFNKKRHHYIQRCI